MVAIKGATKSKGKIAKTGNSGTVGDGASSDAGVGVDFSTKN